MLVNTPLRHASLLIAFSALCCSACDRSSEATAKEAPEASAPAPSSAVITSNRPVANNPPTVKAPKPASAYSVPDRSPEELDQGLRAACQAGAQSKQPLLIEFSAPWCGDCRRLAEMKKEPALAKKLGEVPHYVVNVGHFDRHDGLLKDFKIRAIANWKIVGTDDCEKAIAEWPRLAGRTLEPQSSDKISSAELVAWLDEKMK